MLGLKDMNVIRTQDLNGRLLELLHVFRKRQQVGSAIFLKRTFLLCHRLAPSLHHHVSVLIYQSQRKLSKGKALRQERKSGSPLNKDFLKFPKQNYDLNEKR